MREYGALGFKMPNLMGSEIWRGANLKLEVHDGRFLKMLAENV